MKALATLFAVAEAEDFAFPCVHMYLRGVAYMKLFDPDRQHTITNPSIHNGSSFFSQSCCDSTTS